MVYGTTIFKLVNTFLVNSSKKKTFFLTGTLSSLSPYTALTQCIACMLSPASGQ